ncbi:MAG: beta-D-galactosidase, partial [Deltaproteobacteria bacterium]|nr:beta-D-galactosidase [Deltaproteobacteria bacterium]
MVVTDLKHLGHQVSMTDALRNGIDFLLRPDIHLIPDGRVDIDGDRVFALVQRYETVMTDAPRFEYHRKYIDIQYIVSGEEIIGWAPAERMVITEE